MTIIPLTCAGCNKTMRRFPTSAPQGVAACMDCKRAGVGLKHGSDYAYKKRKCRCDVCREGQRIRMAEYARMVTERDGVSPTAQFKRSMRGADPLAMPQACKKCGDPLENIREASSARPMHKRCRTREFRISTDERRAIYERDGWSCQICLLPVQPDSPRGSHWFPSLDHIVPQSAQLIPDHSPANLRTAHFLCNGMRGAGTYYTDHQVREMAMKRFALAS